MNRYYELIKNNIIDFDKLILDKYYILGLSEVDTVILIKLNNLLKNGKRLLSTSDIVPYMSINEDVCSKRIVDLVNEGFISLELSSIDAQETFNMDETYKRLSYALDSDEEQQLNNQEENNIKMIVKLVEKELGRILSPLELEMVNRWFIEYDFSFEEIEETVISALKNKTHGVKYIERILYNKNKSKNTINPKAKNDIKELFNKVYVNHR